MDFWKNADKVVTGANTSYSWICSRIGIAESTISTQRKYNTEPKIGFVVKFARLMGVSIESLVDLPGPIVVPERLENLMEMANGLSDEDISIVSDLIRSLAARSREKSEEGRKVEEA